MTRSPTKFLTTRQLAQLWLVSEATIKRWADAGQLNSSRTVGGHRRFPVAEVMRFQNEHGMGVATATAGGVGAASASYFEARLFDGAEAAGQFYEAVVRGHSGEASALLLEAHMLGAPLERIFDAVVTRAMRRVGDAWHADELSVAEEHLATSTATLALQSLAASVRKRVAHAPEAVCCAAEDELHMLATLCARTLLEAEGWEARDLGAHTPFFALAEYVTRQRPALVCVSSTLQRELEHNARDYAQLVAAARACGARVVLGGEGFRAGAVRQRFPADLHAESFTDLAEFLRGLDRA